MGKTFLASLFFLICFALSFSQTEKDSIKFLELKKLELRRDLFAKNIPEPKSWVNDHEKLYTDEQRNTLNAFIDKLEIGTSVEIAIVTLDTTQVSSANFDAMSLKIAQAWAVGKSGKDNGIVITISKGHHRIRIQNGIGIEKVISDDQTQHLINQYFIPEFKKGNYYKGTLDGLGKIKKLLHN